MSDDSKNLSRVEDILSGEDYIPTKPMSRIEKLLLEGGGPGGKLPEVTSDDNGKILKVKDGAWDKGEDISGDKLPQVSSSDNGKVLKVVQGEWNIDKDEGDRLPVITPTDNDKILTAFGGQWIAKPDRVPSAQDCVEGSVLVARNNGWNGEQLPEVNAVPTPTSSDIGKVLKAVDEGEYDWENGTQIVTLTQESYDALSTSQKRNGTVYFVHQGNFYEDEDAAIYFLDKCYSKVPVDDVKQSPTNDGVYDILLSGSTAGSSETTEGAKKSSTYPLKYSAHGGILSIGDGDTNSGGVSLGWAGSPNVTVERTNQTTGAKNWIEMVLDDINFNSNSSGTPETWDGTNTSLKAAIAAAARAGGSEAVVIEAADYHALSQSEKEDPTKIYFVKAGTVIIDPISVIPRNPSSGNIDCNTGSANYNTSAVYAFDGVMNSPPDGRATYADGVTAWYPGYGNAPSSAWASYHFDSAITNLVKLEVYAYNMATSNPSAIFTTPVIVEGSTDGTNWFNILANGASSFDLNTKETEFVKNVIPLDNMMSVSYIRLRFLNQINGYNDTNFAIAEIYAYTGTVVVYDNSIYYGGKQYTEYEPAKPYVELTQAEYDALPSSKESDGIIYFING